MFTVFPELPSWNLSMFALFYLLSISPDSYLLCPSNMDIFMITFSSSLPSPHAF